MVFWKNLKSRTRVLERELRRKRYQTGPDETEHAAEEPNLDVTSQTEQDTELHVGKPTAEIEPLLTRQYAMGPEDLMKTVMFPVSKPMGRDTTSDEDSSTPATDIGAQVVELQEGVVAKL
ncbi:hypothetical protein R5R35_014521 [Gryllus longicercus]|uniref:Uncharacterized protein n=1 Tax=Gryllus longicercus TaxID=2509291 RepID=A0AAN9V4G6_9ORTH